MSKRKAKVAKAAETKREKFVRLCEHRMGRALKYVNMVGALAAPVYDYNKADGELIVSGLQEAVDNVKQRYEGNKANSQGFRLNASAMDAAMKE